jgi:uncharacterized protein YukJ
MGNNSSNIQPSAYLETKYQNEFNDIVSEIIKKQLKTNNWSLATDNSKGWEAIRLSKQRPGLRSYLATVNNFDFVTHDGIRNFLYDYCRDDYRCGLNNFGSTKHRSIKRRRSNRRRRRSRC